MDRKSLRELSHNAKNFLTIGDQNYKHWVFRYTFLELEKDMNELGDITTQVLFGPKDRARGMITAGEDGVLAGAEEIQYFLVSSTKKFKPGVHGSFAVKFFKRDGEAIHKGDKIAEISGYAWDLLAVERVVLNLLMRMSGVATTTRSVVNIVGDGVLITPTRKTLWGLLDKRAVMLGGGGTHRLNLNDAILVKDNHLALLDGDLGKVVSQIERSTVDCRFVEIEVDNIGDAVALSSKLSDSSIDAVRVVMFDNMKPAEITDALTRIKERDHYKNLLFEASGGINLDNVSAYAKTGVDIISIGCLTTDAKSLDMSFTVEK